MKGEPAVSGLSVVFTGGGTGGHLYPALALATRLRELDADSRILFIGTARLEATKVPAAGFPLKIIAVRGLTGPWSFSALLRKLHSALLLALGIPLWQAMFALWRFKPDVVVGTGGYVCGPVTLAARLMGIPSLSVEQNIRPGLTTRILARLVDVAALVTEESLSLYPLPKARFARHGKPKLVVTGNPVRSEILSARRGEGLAAFGLGAERRTLLIYGGSLGSPIINRVSLQALEMLADEYWFRSGIQVLHVTGKPSSPAGAPPEQTELGEIARRARLRYQAHPYLDNLPLALAAADLAICRGGGTTIAELSARGLPAIIVPWPGAANNEQYFNSKPLAQAGGAILMREDELTPGRLAAALKDLLRNPARLEKMSEASRSLGRPKATDEIIALVRKLASGRQG
ncbi:MAG: undecaprenyldiphospho-muramoylpentapeptide beta-N-acetylglucosaminyltransferase [Armatimonadetes bacterium]|nr:undecaprenyldiphospho-muramoylpentapeptide beta-N-acetylglucosaminyltransferase [Armatimonadota bacterium]NIM24718.1 undecaprenyldiphospho-muramoylpentapeptide beta-N-acetylglucosaminyltransferase [Armatimonadota bacterium]NIM68598.1 undecaprenyldiphospho-muramoylpentapeptide beta-N-acetylglucosaminyltransferase [Armatimonadota bacterium]NIM77115.1 undecaprenyldiphospho-muramoylpentapeptide beta-N-acetylglucosaminyltransferase [Armatimonadota bacterium]NIN06792.1 undecaprenyldiphospho-muramo